MSGADVEALRAMLEHFDACYACMSGADLAKAQALQREADAVMDSRMRETPITLQQAYLAMFDFLEYYCQLDPDGLGSVMGELSLAGGERPRPMSAAVFPRFVSSVVHVLEAEGGPEGYTGANLRLTPFAGGGA